MIIDSNLIIYASRPQHDTLRTWIAENDPSVSAVSYVEVLGYPAPDGERQYLEEFFAAAPLLHITQEVLDRATAIRRQRRIHLGDALIAATVPRAWHAAGHAQHSRFPRHRRP